MTRFHSGEVRAALEWSGWMPGYLCFPQLFSGAVCSHWNKQTNKTKTPMGRLVLWWRLAVMLCFICKSSALQTHIASSELQALIKVSEASFLRHVLFVSQNALMTFWDTRSLKGSGKGNEHVRISMSGVSEATCYGLTAAWTLPSSQ